MSSPKTMPVGAISASQPAAVESGARVLMRGGNAVDAAVTCALVQGVIDPHSCGLGGYALVNLYWAANGSSIGLDAPALAGAGVSEEMWEDAVIGPNPDGWGYFLQGQVNEVGYTSICTPGAVKMLGTLLDRWGTIPWAQAAEPAIRLAEDGFVVDAFLAGRWTRPAAHPETCSNLETIICNPEASRIYLGANGTPPLLGQTLTNPGYAHSLRHLAEHGSDDFYHGTLADRMAADLQENGSYVTRADLESYGLREDAAVRGSYRDYTISSAAPPHGGATLLAILNILEGYDLAAMEHNSADYVLTLGRAMKAAFADRNPHMADPAFVDVPVEWMISKGRAEEWRRHIAEGKPIEVDFGNGEAPSTTHVSVVDGAGNCVSLTHSLGSASGVITPGLGFMYNNSMINFHPHAGHPNSIAPGKGRTTGMAPTIVYKEGRPILVIGAPGATRIITSIVQVLVNVLDFGMDILAALNAPRIDCQVGPIRCELRIPSYVVQEVNRIHPAVHIPHGKGGFGLVHAVQIDPESGAFSGAADPGADGMALVV